MPEPVLFTTPIGLKSIGAEFDSDAPFCGCRICGALYQSKLDRLCRKYVVAGVLYEVVRRTSFSDSVWGGPQYAINILNKANERRQRWRELHARRYHSSDRDNAVTAALSRSGQAFTPEAAHKLAPFGITPLDSGYADKAIADALFDAPRAPQNDVEG